MEVCRVAAALAAPCSRTWSSRAGGSRPACRPPAPVPTEALPAGWRGARAPGSWRPVASEVPDAWADVPAPDARASLFGWQGILRRLVAGERVTRLAPEPSPLLARSDIVGVSRFDVPRDLSLAWLMGMLRPGARAAAHRRRARRRAAPSRRGGPGAGQRYPAVAASACELDPTGAGDATLAAVLAARLAHGARSRLGGASPAPRRARG